MSNRVKVAFKAIGDRLKLKHVCATNENNWGYAIGSGMVDEFCAKCQKLIRSVPIEDHPLKAKIDKMQNDVILCNGLPGGSN